MSKQKVSVIITCYNVEQYIDRCLQSVINQTYGLENLEVICVDDISTDETYKKLQEYQKLYPNSIIAIKSQEKGNCGGARNIGLDIASGEYIFFLDSDDYLDSKAIEKMYDKAVEYDCDIVQCDMNRTSLNDAVGQKVGDDVFLNLEDELTRRQYILNHYYINVIGRLYKASLIQKNEIRFKPNEVYEDNFFSAVLIFTAKSVYYLRESLYLYYSSPSSITRNNYIEQNELKHLKLHSDVSEELQRLGLWEKVRTTYWTEYEFFIFGKTCIESVSRLNRLNDRLKERVYETILNDLPDVTNNYYISSLSWPENVAIVKDIKRYALNKGLVDQIHVCFGLHDKTGRYCINVATVILSILRNTKQSVCFHIFCDDTVTLENRQKFEGMVEKTSSNVVFHDVNVNELQTENNEWYAMYTIGSLFRLMIPRVLGHLEKVIYLDADLLFNIDIAQLWNVDISNYAIGAIHDIGFEHGMAKAVPIKKGEVEQAKYFNSGILVMNIQKILEKGDLAQLCFEYLSQNPDSMMPDQDALNVVFKDETLLLDEKWNVSQRYERLKPVDELRECIYHYIGARCIRFCNPTKFDHLYMQIRQETPWGEYAQDEWSRGMFSAYDKVDQLQRVIQAISDGTKKRIFYGINTNSMKIISNFIKPREGDYFICKDPIVDLDGTRFGVPIYDFETLQKEPKGSYVVFVLPEADNGNAISKLESIGLVNGESFFNIPRLLTIDQGGYVW